jgi:hypothetical protein
MNNHGRLCASNTFYRDTQDTRDSFTQKVQKVTCGVTQLKCVCVCSSCRDQCGRVIGTSRTQGRDDEKNCAHLDNAHSSIAGNLGRDCGPSMSSVSRPVACTCERICSHWTMSLWRGYFMRESQRVIWWDVRVTDRCQLYHALGNEEI